MPELIVLDLKMPKMDGLQVLRVVASGAKRPADAVSAHSGV